MKEFLKRPYMKGLTWEEKLDAQLAWAKANLHIAESNLKEAENIIAETKTEITKLEKELKGNEAGNGIEL